MMITPKNIISSYSANFTILTTSDFPYHGAPENFVRLLSLGLNFHKKPVEIVRFWGKRYNYNNDTSINLSNYLFNKPAKNILLKALKVFFQHIYIPIFLIKHKINHPENIIILYGIDRISFNLPFLIICKVLNIKCLRIITEIYQLELKNNNFIQIINHFLEYLQIRYCDKYFDGLIVLSKNLSNRLIKYGVKNERIEIIHHFIDFDVKELSEEKSDSFNIGYFGTISIENGAIDLIDAFNLIKNSIQNCKLFLIGNVVNNVVSIIKADNLDLTNIIMPGHLNKEDVQNYLKNCSVLVNPRRQSILSETGFPTKIGEYFASKKPVITTKTGNLSNLLNDKDEVVFCQPNSSESLKCAIEFIYNNYNLATEIGQRGFYWGKNNLDYKINSLKIINFIEKISVL